MKKIISVLLSILMIMSVFSSAVFAAGQTPGDTPMLNSSVNVSSLLSFTGKKATCQSKITLSSGEQLVKITQTLEKQDSLGHWEPVCDPMEKNISSDAKIHSFTNTVTVSGSGKYRVKSVFTVLMGNGVKEMPYKYSSIITI